MSDAYDDDLFVADLLAMCEEIDALEGAERHRALVWWARSTCYSPALMLELRIGKLAREASRAFFTDLTADTAGKAWWDAGARGQASIRRLVGVEGHDKAFYGADPFRTVHHEDRDWIAAAVPPVPALSDRIVGWCHLDIAELILWCPRTGDVRLWGTPTDHAELLTPNVVDDDLAVYADPAAFFRDWAARRIDALERCQATPGIRPNDWPDGFMPGAFVVGDLGRLSWRDPGARRIVAGPGCAADDLRACAMRAARLPAFVGGTGVRG